MISYLQGTLLEAWPEGCIILTPGGVGYCLHIPGNLYQDLPGSGEEIALHVHTLVREDALELFGFAKRGELQTFKQLIGVSKLGPKTSLGIVSKFSPQQLQEILLKEDTVSLSRVPGIGAKTAKRIIWELKDSFSLQQTLPGQGQQQNTAQEGMFADALAALQSLGYLESEVRPVLLQVQGQEPDLMLEELIRSVLKQISKSRSQQQ
ncbi:MAG: Holliday junction branch migration protein RuvA [Desulfohalobiaceae bacterium]